MLSVYYQLLMKRIKEQVPEVANIELFCNQYNRTSEELPIITPAVYLDFGNITWKDTGLNTQEGLLLLDVHVVLPHLLPANAQNFTWYDNDVLDFVQKIHLALHGYQMIDAEKLAYSTKLTRINMQHDTTSDSLHIFILTYQCTIIDNSTYSDRNLTEFIIQNLDMN